MDATVADCRQLFLVLDLCVSRSNWNDRTSLVFQNSCERPERILVDVLDYVDA